MIFQYFSYMSMVRDELLLPGVFLKEEIYILFLCFHGTFRELTLAIRTKLKNLEDGSVSSSKGIPSHGPTNILLPDCT